ncbi:MAG: phosphopantothenoylcysteine decarboxylase, partial [Clostridiales bacterium]|nr:phosphopantothenoylcysteine decarboxylase [Clostridiales bacterium]
APADYTAAQYEEQKIKKQLGEQLTLHLKQTTDVAALLGKTKQKNQIFVGFAAETQNGLENARRKLQSKNLDMICLNDVSQPDAGFVVDTNRITMVTPKVVKPLPLLSKQQVAHRILDEILHLQQDKV